MRPWLVVFAYWAVVMLIGYLAFEVTLWFLLGLPPAMLAVAWLLGRSQRRPADRASVVRDEQLW